MVNSPDDDEGDEVPQFGGENLPFEQIFASLGIPMPAAGEPIDVRALLASLQDVMARSGQSMTTEGGGVNWLFAKDMARKVVAALGPDPTPSSRQRHDIADSVHLAELWLNDATVFPAVAAPPAAWSRAEWVENTMATWQTMVEPIVSTIASSLGDVMMRRISDEPELAGMQQMFQPMLQQSASSMFGVQFGQALGKLATEVVSATEVSMPLLARPQVALLPTNLAAFGEGLDLSERDVMLYLSLREAARQRLFADVGWLGPQVVAFVQHYAREITVDLSALEESFDDMGGDPMSMNDLAQLGSEMSRSLFSPQRTPEQAEVLERLETLLALVEGWVDDVVAQAGGRFMPSAHPLAETVRRRRAAGGPAEQVFASLVGLELSPRRTRDAANLWAALRTARGVEGRDAVWHHPDTMPSAHDLDDPLGFVSGESRHASDDLDAELAKLIEEERGE